MTWLFSQLLPFCSKQAGGHNQREPSPTGTFATLALLEAIHRFCALHLGVACCEGDVFREVVTGLELDAMTQRTVQLLKFCGCCQIMIGNTT